VQKEIPMLKMICAAAVTAALVVLAVPSKVDGYGAAHVGYTQVGPNGAYHTGATAVSGPGGTYAAGHTTAYGAGGAYRGGSYGGSIAEGEAGVARGHGAAATGGYTYAPSYYGGAGGAAAGGYHYGYVR
jgi:heterogeneous nuclear ribonucleoprotein A1/A3